MNRNPRRKRDPLPPALAFGTDPVARLRDREVWINAVARDDALTPSARLLAVILASHLNLAHGQLNPSMRRLAECTAQSEQAVIDQLKALVSRGWIAKAPTRGRTSNSYQLFNRITPGPDLELNPQAAPSDGTATPKPQALNPQPLPAQSPSSVHPNKENRLNIPRRPAHATNRAPRPRQEVGTAKTPVAPNWGEHGARLAAMIGGQLVFATWFEGAEIISYEPRLVITVEKPCQRNWILNNFRTALERTFEVDDVEISVRQKVKANAA